jgi:hypothetical protein
VLGLACRDGLLQKPDPEARSAVSPFPEKMKATEDLRNNNGARNDTRVYQNMQYYGATVRQSSLRSFAPILFGD